MSNEDAWGFALICMVAPMWVYICLASSKRYKAGEDES